MKLIDQEISWCSLNSKHFFNPNLEVIEVFVNFISLAFSDCALSTLFNKGGF